VVQTFSSSVLYNLNTKISCTLAHKGIACEAAKAQLLRVKLFAIVCTAEICPVFAIPLDAQEWHHRYKMISNVHGGLRARSKRSFTIFHEAPIIEILRTLFAAKSLKSHPITTTFVSRARRPRRQQHAYKSFPCSDFSEGYCAPESLLGSSAHLLLQDPKSDC